MQAFASFRLIAGPIVLAMGISGCTFSGEFSTASASGSTTGADGNGGMGVGGSGGMGAGGIGGGAGVGGNGGAAGAGGAAVESGHGPSAMAMVSGGNVSQSANYTLVFTVGQSTTNQGTTTSPSYRLQGGLVGANGSLP